jgi:hypothetical protein
MPQPIRLYWFRNRHPGRVNFGDDLSPLLVELMSGRAVEHAEPHMADLLAVGSVLQHLGRSLLKPRSWVERLKERRLDRVRVWGSGTFGPTQLPPRVFVHAVAVRGSQTQAAMGLAADLPIGDPGLLVDRFSLPAAKRVRWGLIPHVHDVKAPGVAMLTEQLGAPRIVNLRDRDILATIAAIRHCDFVVSSSLHGLITADALGVPNIWALFTEDFFGGEWKFRDYFSAVGRTVAGPLRVLPDAPLPDLPALEALAATADQALVERRRAALEAAFRQMNL